MDSIISGVRESLIQIKEPRFYESERGFQGQLLVQLSKHLQLSENTIIEQEHQKRLAAHGLNIRPDIIVHEPFNPEHHGNRSQGNFAAIELKLNASEQEALEDLKKLSLILEKLEYSVAFLINIASQTTYGYLVPKEVRDKIICFAVSLEGASVHLVE